MLLASPATRSSAAQSAAASKPDASGSAVCQPSSSTTGAAQGPSTARAGAAEASSRVRTMAGQSQPRGLSPSPGPGSDRGTAFPREAGFDRAKYLPVAFWWRDTGFGITRRRKPARGSRRGDAGARHRPRPWLEDGHHVDEQMVIAIAPVLDY